MLLTPGPVDRDFTDGELINWHLEVLNNSECTAVILLSVFALYGLFPKPIPIGTTSAELRPGEYTFLNIIVDPKYEHTIPTIEIPNNDIYITLYGRNTAYKQMSGAVYPRHSLVHMKKPLCDLFDDKERTD